MIDQSTIELTAYCDIPMTNFLREIIKYHRGWKCFLLLLSVLVGFHLQASCDDVNVWATGCTEKVQDQKRAQLKHDGIWDVASSTVRLDAVRDEQSPFQVVITSKRKNVTGIKVSPSRLRSGNNELSADAIKLYLVHLVNVYAATDDHGERGRWPDALVPLTRTFDMSFFWHSQTVNHQSVWVDVEIPRNQVAGVYRGTVAVTCSDGELGRINIELTVHDIELPEQRSFPVHVGLYEKHIARMHGVSLGSEEFDLIFKNYLRFFLENRIDPRTSPGFSGRIENGQYLLTWTKPDYEQLFLDMGRLQFWISPVPGGVPRSANTEPFSPLYEQFIQQHVQQVIDHAKQNGWYNKLGFHVPVDEPNSAEDYAAVRRWSDAIKSVDAKIPISVTEQPKTENAKWGSLIGHANSWIINGNYLFTDGDSIDARRQAGDNVMWYMSCDQLHPQPNLYIDREAADARMAPWLSWRYQMSGMLYWNAAYWGEVRDPWSDPVTWKTIPCNLPAAGEGSLIYPGNMVQQFTGQENVSGPIGSMRLALLREGLEEIELLRLLGKSGGQEKADEIVSKLCRDIRDFTRDPNLIDQARNHVIREILSRSR